MAKAATKKAVKSAKKGVKPGRRVAAANPIKAVKAAAPVKKPATVISKDELRLQLEKAQATNATLRAKSREATRAAKESAAQIAELEAKVEQLEKKLSSQEKPTTSSAPISDKPAKPRGRRTAVKAEPGESIEAAEPVPADSETPGE